MRLSQAGAILPLVKLLEDAMHGCPSNGVNLSTGRFNLDVNVNLNLRFILNIKMNLAGVSNKVDHIRV